MAYSKRYRGYSDKSPEANFVSGIADYDFIPNYNFITDRISMDVIDRLYFNDTLREIRYDCKKMNRNTNRYLLKGLRFYLAKRENKE